MLDYQFLDSMEFFADKTIATIKAHRIEPVLGFAVVALDMDVRWLVTIAGIEEETIRSTSQHSRHAGIVVCDADADNMHRPDAEACSSVNCKAFLVRRQ